MKYIDKVTQLLEANNKDRFIDKNPNLSPNQKEEIKRFFHDHREQESQIKQWEKAINYTYADFMNIICKFNARFTPQLTIDKLKEGEDYDYLGENDDYKFYQIYTYKASVAFASNKIGYPCWHSYLPGWYQNAKGYSENVKRDYPSRVIIEKDKYGEYEVKEYGGACWCISMNHTSRYWNDYTRSDKGSAILISFVFAISKEDKQKYYNEDDNGLFNKLAIQLSVEYETKTVTANTIYLSNDSVIPYTKEADSKNCDNFIAEHSMRILENDYKLKRINFQEEVKTIVDTITDEFIEKYGADIVSAYNDISSQSPFDTAFDIGELYEDNVEPDKWSLKNKLDNIKFYITKYYSLIESSYIKNCNSYEDLASYILDLVSDRDSIVDFCKDKCNMSTLWHKLFVSKFFTDNVYSRYRKEIDNKIIGMLKETDSNEDSVKEIIKAMRQFSLSGLGRILARMIFYTHGEDFYAVFDSNKQHELLDFIMKFAYKQREAFAEILKSDIKYFNDFGRSFVESQNKFFIRDNLFDLYLTFDDYGIV